MKLVLEEISHFPPCITQLPNVGLTTIEVAVCLKLKTDIACDWYVSNLLLFQMESSWTG